MSGNPSTAVVLSSAIPTTNPEVLAAGERSIPVYRRADALRALVATRRGIAVAGSHGKTTTSSMLALILRGAGWEPTFIIGGDVNEVGTNAAYADGEWLVVEADESDGTFLELPAEAAIVTNVEPDHLDHYGSFAGLRDAFDAFLSGIPGARVVCADDPEAAALGHTRGCSHLRLRGRRRLPRRGVVGRPSRQPASSSHATGFPSASSCCLYPVPTTPPTQSARPRWPPSSGCRSTPPPAPSPGSEAWPGASSSAASSTASPWSTTTRTCPLKCGPHPQRARDGGWGRVIAVFQPHRYSRTASLWRDFADAFTDADVVVLTDVYAAGEAPRPGVSGRLVLQAVLDAHPETSVVYLPHRADVVSFTPKLARAGDVVLTMGAGDLTTVPGVWLGTG